MPIRPKRDSDESTPSTGDGSRRRRREDPVGVGRSHIPPRQGRRRKLNGKQIDLKTGREIKNPAPKPEESSVAAPSKELAQIVAALQKLALTTDTTENKEKTKGAPPPMGRAAGVVASEAPKRFERPAGAKDTDGDQKRLPFRSVDYSEEKSSEATDAVNYDAAPAWGAGQVVAVDEVRSGSSVFTKIASVLVVILLGVFLFNQFILTKWRDRGNVDGGGEKINSVQAVAAAERASKETFTKFLQAQEFNKKVQHIRFGARLLPAMAGYYLRNEDEPPVISMFKSGKLEEIDGKQYFQATASIPGVSARPVHFEKIEDRFLLDWESFVGYGEMPWNDFLKEKPTKPVLFRLIAEKSSEYRAPYNDQSKFLSLRLSDKKHRKNCFAYLSTRGPEGEKVRLHFEQSSKRRHRITARLYFEPEGITGGTPRIERIVRYGWLDPGE